MKKPKQFSKALYVLAIVAILLAVYALYLATIYVRAYKDAFRKITENKEDIGYAYRVSYPADYFINQKEQYNLVLSQRNLPPGNNSRRYVGIEVFIGAIHGYTLEEWLRAVSTDKFYSLEEGTDHLCDDAVKKLQDQLAKIQYGGPAGRPVDRCLYYGVQNIRKTHIPVLDSQKGSEALEFDVTDSNGYYTHTLVTFGTGGVWDIYKSYPEIPDYDADRAYQLMRESFKFETN